MIPVIPAVECSGLSCCATNEGKTKVLWAYWLPQKACAGTRTDLDMATSARRDIRLSLVKLSGFKQDNIDTMEIMEIHYFHYCPCLQDNIPDLSSSTE